MDRRFAFEVLDDFEEEMLAEEVVQRVHRPRRFHIRVGLDNWDDYDFVQRFRLMKPTVLQVVSIIEERLVFLGDNRHTTIAPIVQVLVALQLVDGFEEAMQRSEMNTVYQFRRTGQQTVRDILLDTYFQRMHANALIEGELDEEELMMWCIDLLFFFFIWY